MKFKSDRSELELRENELHSSNKSFLRGYNTQTIRYADINKIEVFKWKTAVLIFITIALCFLGISMDNQEPIGGGYYLIHDPGDAYMQRQYTIGWISAGVLLLIGALFYFKYGKHSSLYLRYNIGGKRIKRSVYTSEDLDEIEKIKNEIQKRQ